MDFQAKLGPLPVWVWGLTLGGAAVGYYYWSQLKDNNGTTISTDPEAVNAVESAAGYVTDRDAIDGAFTPGTASGSTLATSTAEESTDTNSAWLIRAVQALVGKGVSPLEAQTALGKYLDGESLSVAESSLVNRAIVALGGLPPDGAPIPSKPTDAASAVGIKSWQRLQDGTVRVLMSDGSYVGKTLQEYIASGMPSFAYNAYENQTYRVPSNGTTVAQIASKYGTSVDNIVVLNRWKAIPNLKKGNVVKVPSQKGTAK